ncbi:MAG: peptidylprolyl isomerase [Flavobacteriales bacterium]
MTAQSTRTKLLAVLWGLIPGGAALAQGKVTERRPLVEIRTELGIMVVALYNETPQHRDNFLKLVRAHAYDSLLFHRVIPGLMVQGGDPDSKRAAPGAMLGNWGPGYTLPAEVRPGLIHKKGALAAARQGDDENPERRSNGSQFYIVQGKTFTPEELQQMEQRSARYGIPLTYTEADRRIYATAGGAPHLDGNYTVFGEVLDGLEVIDAIAALPCDGRDRPLKDIRIFMRVLE